MLSRMVSFVSSKYREVLRNTKQSSQHNSHVLTLSTTNGNALQGCRIHVAELDQA